MGKLINIEVEEYLDATIVNLVFDSGDVETYELAYKDGLGWEVYKMLEDLDYPVSYDWCGE